MQSNGSTGSMPSEKNSKSEGTRRITGLRIPISTYRLQFNRQFSLTDAMALVPYLYTLGMTDLYASPLLAARQGSSHGYDVTDPTRLNPELGSKNDFAALSSALQRYGMGLLLDIVPNHMAAGNENPWWNDVLQNGRDSSYAVYFDIDWQTIEPGLNNKVLLPILGTPYGEALENQELAVIPAQDGLCVCYHEQRLPLGVHSSYRILKNWLEALNGFLAAKHPAASQIEYLLYTLKMLPEYTKTVELTSVFRQAWEGFRRLYSSSEEIKTYIDDNLRLLNGKKGDPQSFNDLDQILSGQAYRLAFWKLANEEINYRRFFDVAGLVSMRVENKQVFEAAHSLVFNLIAAGLVTGLRIDHIDGLYDPELYLNWLFERLSTPETKPGFYIVIEKILGSSEKLPSGWPIYGTTGYDFLNDLNGLFVDKRGIAALDDIYTRLNWAGIDFGTIVYKQKKRVMQELFASDVNRLARQLNSLAKKDRRGRDFTFSELKRSIVEVTASLGVYRTYIRSFTVTTQDRIYIEKAASGAIERCPAVKQALDFLRNLLLLEFPGTLPAAQQQDRLGFVMRWQQFTGPVTAKGYEDTSLYVYNRLVSLNEVGGNPESAGISIQEFHRRNKTRQERMPHTINATSTHDTKRSEDIRARINVLSEIPAAWAQRVEHWRRMNRPKRTAVKDRIVPDGNMELLIYQTLIGAWPLQKEEIPVFGERLQAYMIKAAREAKTDTDWLNPDTEYENALKNFVVAILKTGNGNSFPEDFAEFKKITAYYGALNSLSQTLVKIASPGIPDFYQGTELWNFSLVDPDNRRPVDFKKRAELLEQILQEEARGLLELAVKLLNCWEDGRVKLFLVYKALNFRKACSELFTEGEYHCLEITGSRYEHICAFTRHLGSNWALAAIPRLSVRLQMANGVPDEDYALPVMKFPLGKAAWENDALLLPGQAPDHWRNIFTGEVITVIEGTEEPSSARKILPLADVFRSFPVALLAGK